jgi:hypothetical protein
MALATWKDLVIDAVDAPVMARFWAETLGLAVDPRESLPGYVRLTGPTPQHAVWIASVPEPVTVKQRVHLDVHAGSLEEVLARGATSADLDSFRWKIVRDPEGGELCVFVRDEVPDHRLYELGVDVASDPRDIARWWAEALGATYGVDEAEGWAWAEDIPGAPFECIVFCRVPEPKTVKNRIHWDLHADVDALVAAGARVLDRQEEWTVLADPEGNEFCAFAPREG